MSSREPPTSNFRGVGVHDTKCTSITAQRHAFITLKVEEEVRIKEVGQSASGSRFVSSRRGWFKMRRFLWDFILFIYYYFFEGVVVLAVG